IYQNVGMAYAATAGRQKEAETAYQEALAIFEPLMDKDLAADQQQDLAICYNSVGVLHYWNDRPDEAKAAYQKALAILDRLVAEHGDEIKYQVTSAGVYNNWGNVYNDANQSKEAEAAYLKAIEIQELLARGPHPNVSDRQDALAMSYTNLATLYSRANEP